MPVCTNTEVARRQLLPMVDESFGLAKIWLLANWREKGLFQYLYDTDKRRYWTRRNNELRPLMAARSCDSSHAARSIVWLAPFGPVTGHQQILAI